MPAPGVGARSQNGTEVKVRSRCRDEKLAVQANCNGSLS